MKLNYVFEGIKEWRSSKKLQLEKAIRVSDPISKTCSLWPFLSPKTLCPVEIFFKIPNSFHLFTWNKKEGTKCIKLIAGQLKCTFKYVLYFDDISYKKETFEIIFIHISFFPTWFSVFGNIRNNEPWTLIKLNFSSVLGSKCQEKDYEKWLPQDYNSVSLTQGCNLDIEESEVFVASYSPQVSSFKFKSNFFLCFCSPRCLFGGKCFKVENLLLILSKLYFITKFCTKWYAFHSYFRKLNQKMIMVVLQNMLNIK